MYRDLFLCLHHLLAQAVDEQIFPGACIGIVETEGLNHKKYYYSYGYTDYSKTEIVNHHTYYDLASLTKPLATTLSILSLINSNKINFEDTLSSLLEAEINLEKKSIRLFNLLHHNSGLPPYHEFYKELINHEGATRKKILTQLILNSPLANSVGEKQVYSDLGYMILGMIVELKASCPLDQYVETMIYHPWDLEKNLFFRKSPAIAKSGYAPTEWCPWRQRVIQGEVHDENAAVVGGVAGHAGLFGNMKGVLDLISLLLDVVKGRREHPRFRSSDLQQAVIRQDEEGSWGLGFDTPTPGASSSGRYFSAQSFGHLGFTGTSFWVDPEKERAIVVLTNRVHPDRHNNKIREFRPRLHDLVMEVLGL